MFFNTSISNAINTSCLCNFDSTYITEDRLVCDESRLSQITYRAKIVDYKNFTSTQLVAIIQSWINSGPRVPNSVAIISFDASCPVAINSYSDPICQVVESTLTPTPTPTGTDTSGQSAGPAVAGGAVAAVLLIIVIIAVVIIVVAGILYQRKRLAMYICKNNS